MPFKLRKAPRKDLYWVVGPDGKHHSKEPLPKERAEAQMKALYSAMRREEKAIVPTAREEEAIEKKMEGGGTSDDIARIQTAIDELKRQTPKITRYSTKTEKLTAQTNQINIANLEKILDALKEGEAVDTLKEMEGANALLSLKKGNGRHSLHGSGPIPQLSILQQIAKAAYSTSPPQQIGPFKLLGSTPTLKFYGLPDPDDSRFTDTIVVGIRGTKTSDKQDLWADAQLAIGKLEETPRWKKDLADFKSFMSRIRNPNDVDVYGVGHSLGSAILDMFLKKNLIQQGVSYNGAIQLGDAQKDLNNRRIYQDGDPLLAIMGRSAKNVEIRPKKVKEQSIGRRIANVASYFIPYVGLVTKGMDSLDAHALDNFIGGTHRTNVIKKLGLQDEGHSLTQLAKASGIPRKTLQEVYNRGIGAYSNTNSKYGVSPSVRMKGSFKKGVNAPMSQKLSKEQWAMARVYSFIDGNPKHDTDLRGGRMAVASAQPPPPPPPPPNKRECELPYYNPNPRPIPTQRGDETPPATLPADRSLIQRPRSRVRDLFEGMGKSKTVCMPKKEYLAEHKQLTEILAHPSQAKLRKELAKQTAEVEMRGGAGTQPILKRFKKAIRPFLSGLDISIIAQFNRDYDIVNDFLRNTRGTHRQADKEQYLSEFIRNVSRMLEGESELLGKPITIDTEDWVTGDVESQFSTFVEGLLHELGDHPTRGRTMTRGSYTRSTSPFAPPRPMTAEEIEEAKATRGVSPPRRASGRKMRGGMDPQPPASTTVSQRKKNYEFMMRDPAKYLRAKQKAEVARKREEARRAEARKAIAVTTTAIDEEEMDPSEFSGSGRSTYLRQARAKAKAYGLDPKKLVFATDGQHKFSYDGVLFGRKGYGDSLSYAKLEKEGKVPKGTTEMKKRVFHRSHEKIKGNWKQNKVSPNNLALYILW